MERIAVVGAGKVGRSWAMVFARAGHPVRLHDTSADALESAVGLIRQGLEELRRFGLLEGDPAVAVRRVRATSDLEEAVRDADYVQENAPEDLGLKRAVFRRLDELAPSTSILASSTSTFKASQIGEGLPGRGRCIVAHPVNPPHVVPLVEISAAPWTDPAVLARTRDLQARAGQVPIVLRKEIEGFILNRLQAALLREAWRLVDEDFVSVEDLDACVKDGLGLRWAFMGPFETIDLNAPGGVADYARRYGAAFHAFFRDAAYRPWGGALAARIEGERRRALAPERRAEREAWRDRRLMALLAHKREQERPVK